MKNSDTAGHKGYDAGKKVSGIKRYIAVDSQGLPPHAITVTAANVTDRKEGIGRACTLQVQFEPDTSPAM